MDGDSSDYDVEEDRRNSDVGVDESGYTANVRNLDCTNIDCLSPENIKCEQDQQPEIKMIRTVTVHGTVQWRGVLAFLLTQSSPNGSFCYRAITGKLSVHSGSRL